MKKFTEYLEDKDVKLLPWQKKAATEFLKSVRTQQQGGSGKTFIARLLLDFIQTHGNDFELDGLNANSRPAAARLIVKSGRSRDELRGMSDCELLKHRGIGPANLSVIREILGNDKCCKGCGLPYDR